MFKNIGGKIKTLAKLVTWIGIIGSIIGGIIIMSNNEGLAIVGLLVMLIGSLISWVGSFFTYGFGELIERTCLIEERSRNSLYSATEGNLELSDTASILRALEADYRSGKISSAEYSARRAEIIKKFDA